MIATGFTEVRSDYVRSYARRVLRHKREVTKAIFLWVSIKS
jgi:hypothetical protein